MLYWVPGGSLDPHLSCWSHSLPRQWGLRDNSFHYRAIGNTLCLHSSSAPASQISGFPILLQPSGFTDNNFHTLYIYLDSSSSARVVHYIWLSMAIIVFHRDCMLCSTPPESWLANLSTTLTRLHRQYLYSFHNKAIDDALCLYSSSSARVNCILWLMPKKALHRVYAWLLSALKF